MNQVSCLLCDDHTYLTKQDVMDIYHMSLSTVDRLIRIGKLERTFISSRRVVFSTADVKAIATKELQEEGIVNAPI